MNNKPFHCLQWHITAKCDQRCQHCYMYDSPTYNEEKKNELGFPDCRKIIDDFSSFVKKNELEGRIHFTGGDPLLRRDFYDIVDYALSKGIKKWGIMGNPYHIDKESARELSKRSIEFYQVSIDGLEETHDYFRRMGSFKETLRAIEILKENKVHSSVMFTLSKRNSEELLHVIRLASDIGASSFTFGRLTCSGMGKQFKDSLLEPPEFRSLYLEAVYLFSLLKNMGSKTYYKMKDHLWVPLFYEEGLLSDDAISYFPPKIGACSMGKGIDLLADGTVLACRRFLSIVGKMPGESFEEIWKKKEYKQFLDLSLYKKCSKCKFGPVCRGCPAVAFGVSGDHLSPDPQCWIDVDGHGN